MPWDKRRFKNRTPIKKAVVQYLQALMHIAQDRNIRSLEPLPKTIARPRTRNMNREDMPTDVWDNYRHWCPRSEAYTGCDSLLSALDCGWNLRSNLTIYRHHKGSRSSLTFHVLLEKESRLVEMRIIDSPTARRVLRRVGMLPVRRTVPVLSADEDIELVHK